MSNSALGKRYERLLFFTAPITFASLLLLFVAIANNTQSERKIARCYNLAANSIQANYKNLESEWDEVKPVTKSEYWGSSYKLAIQTIIIYSHLGTDCYQVIDKAIPLRYRAHPKEIIASFRKDSVVAADTPFSYAGIEIPDQTKVSLFGIGAKISIMTFAQMLQIILGPLLILWLGSLYNTRYRETYLIGKSQRISEIYPHLINVYPVGYLPEPKRPTLWKQYLPTLITFTYSCMRFFLLSVFILPPVLSYIISLFLLDTGEYRIIFAIIGFIVFLFTLTTLTAEFLRWHVNKIYP